MHNLPPLLRPERDRIGGIPTPPPLPPAAQAGHPPAPSGGGGRLPVQRGSLLKGPLTLCGSVQGAGGAKDSPL